MKKNEGDASFKKHLRVGSDGDALLARRGGRLDRCKVDGHGGGLLAALALAEEGAEGGERRAGGGGGSGGGGGGGRGGGADAGGRGGRASNGTQNLFNSLTLFYDCLPSISFFLPFPSFPTIPNYIMN